MALSAPKEDNPPPEVAPGPEFVHLAMCDDEERAIVPPLGWALSPLIRDQFASILERCGNPEELDRLRAALEARDSL